MPRSLDTSCLRYSFVLFDLDGTLVDSSDGIVAAVRAALRQVDRLREPPDRDTILMEVGKPLEQLFVELGGGGHFHGDNTMPEFPDAAARQFAETYRRYYAEHIKEGLRLYPDTVETLTALRAAGAKLAVVTTKHQAQADLTVAAAGIGEYFDCVYGWQEGRRHKPDPEPFLAALDRLERKGRRDKEGQREESGTLSLDPSIPRPLSAALVVGDTEQDILSARAGGLDCCAVTYGFRPALMLLGLRPDYMVGRLRDVAEIITRPKGSGLVV